MADHPDPTAVLQHWPFVRRHLVFHRRATRERWLLDFLALEQLVSNGAPIALGAARLRAQGLTAGEAGRCRTTLADLEERRALVRWRGAGTRPDSWSLNGDLARWRGLVEPGWSKPILDAVLSCICRAEVANAARLPGQVGKTPRATALSDADHAWRPGLLPVETRAVGDFRARSGGRPGPQPVETRGVGGACRPSLNSAVDDYVVNVSDVDVVRAIERGIELATGGNGIWQGSRHEAKLLELASSINLEQAEELAAQLAAYRVNGEHVRSPVYALDVARRLAQSPSVRSLAGSHDRDGAAG